MPLALQKWGQVLQAIFWSKRFSSSTYWSKHTRAVRGAASAAPLWPGAAGVLRTGASAFHRLSVGFRKCLPGRCRDQAHRPQPDRRLDEAVTSVLRQGPQPRHTLNPAPRRQGSSPWARSPRSSQERSLREVGRRVTTPINPLRRCQAHGCYLSSAPLAPFALHRFGAE
jgi:hypothetical protein